MNLADVKASATSFHNLPDEQKPLSRAKMDIALSWLESELPALSDDDKAACSWVIARMMSTLMAASGSELSGLLTDTAVAYSLAACKLHGLIEDAA